jgi:hypothetical protein
MPNFVYIHETFYDLDKIKAEHPGGYLAVFDAIENEEDLTPLFEASHAMKNLKAIYEMMTDFEIKCEDYQKFKITQELIDSKKGLKKFSYENYHKLAAEVKKNIGKNYKVTSLWYFKVVLMLIFYIFLYYHAILKIGEPNVMRCIYAFTAGVFWVYIGFCTMHDASHYALFNTKSKNIILNNDVISSIWQGWGLWNSFIWFKHHVYRHHSFTGIFGKDPDIIHFSPFFRKTEKDSKVIKLLGKLQDKIAIIFLFFLPGQYLGQIYAYFVGIFKGHVWEVNIKNAFKYTPLHEKILYVISLANLSFCSSYLCVFFIF